MTERYNYLKQFKDFNMRSKETDLNFLIKIQNLKRNDKS